MDASGNRVNHNVAKMFFHDQKSVIGPFTGKGRGQGKDDIILKPPVNDAFFSI